MRGDFRPLVLLQLGFIIVSSILLSLVAGLWIDSQFGTAPFGVLVAMLMGVMAGTVGVFRLVSRVIRELGEDKRE